ncbi:ribonuclease P protein subunit p21 isoform X1 [Rhinoderma darwinii]|uniref:ribonuclease P protein subunit p21 isoform X1 n=1 Tax=Rhinoderma darwinii TaxID=43563 RepID=UPI003F67783C
MVGESLMCWGSEFQNIGECTGDLLEMMMRGAEKVLTGDFVGSVLEQAAHCVLAANPENVELARFYCHTEKTIGKRLVLRQDPSIKRTICKRCSSLLLSGVTCTVRLRKRRGQRLTLVRCLSCGHTKRFLNNPNHKLWSEQPEALLENQPKPDTHSGSQQNLPKERGSSSKTENTNKMVS